MVHMGADGGGLDRSGGHGDEEKSMRLERCLGGGLGRER